MNCVAKDEAKEVEMFQRAASQGHPEAQRNLGTCYMDRKGVVKNEAKAVEMYQLAAAQGNVDAQFDLGG